MNVRCVGDGDDAAIWCCLSRGAAIYTLQLDWRADVRLGDAVTSVTQLDDDGDDDDDVDRCKASKVDIT